MTNAFRPDYLNPTGAEQLAQAIRDYWRGRGATVNAWVEIAITPDHRLGHTLYAVRTDMVNGQPRRR